MKKFITIPISNDDRILAKNVVKKCIEAGYNVSTYKFVLIMPIDDKDNVLEIFNNEKIRIEELRKEKIDKRKAKCSG